MSHAQPESTPEAGRKPPGFNPMRLIILLGVLAVVAGALYYDYFVAQPGVKQANDKLHEVALQNNSKAYRNLNGNGNKADTGLMYSQDVQEVLGMSPTWTKKDKHYTIECYCWWGWIPLNKHYISVLYVGHPDKPHYATHYVNTMPEDDSIPGHQRAKEEGADEPLSATPPVAGGVLPMPPPGGGPGGAKGKGGKGRPKGGGGGIPGEGLGELPPEESKTDPVARPVEPTATDKKKEEPKKDDVKKDESAAPAKDEPKAATSVDEKAAESTDK